MRNKNTLVISSEVVPYLPETILSSADDIGLEDFINGAMWDTKNKRTNPKAKTVLKQLIDFADEMGYDTDPKSPTYIMKTKMTDLVGVNATYRDFFQDFEITLFFFQLNL